MQSCTFIALLQVIIIFVFMKNLLFNHIEFLLPKHNCVIIPDFGGFVVNVIPARYDSEQCLLPPTYAVVFNKALNYNDGLLAKSISEVENVTYDTACRKIKDAVKEINLALLKNVAVTCGGLGVMTKDEDDNIKFVSNSTLIYPAYYGLTNVGLAPLVISEETETVEERRRPVLRYAMTGVAAAAVAALFYFAPINMDYFRVNNSPQQADIVHTIASYVISPAVDSSAAEMMTSATDVMSEKVTTQSSMPEAMTTETEVSMSSDATFPMANSMDEVDVKPARTYYIVVGGEESQKRAERLLDKIRTNDFKHAELVLGSVCRVYVASFHDKKEAERYLDIFRLENPKYKTAWLYSKKNS